MAKKEQDSESLFDGFWESVRRGNEVRKGTDKDTLKKKDKENVKGFFDRVKDAGKPK